MVKAYRYEEHVLLWVVPMLRSHVAVLVDALFESKELLPHPRRRELPRLVRRSRLHDVEHLLLYRIESSAAARPPRTHQHLSSIPAQEADSQEPSILILLLKVVCVSPRRKLRVVRPILALVRSVVLLDRHSASFALPVRVHPRRLECFHVRNGGFELALGRALGEGRTLQE